MAILLTVSHGIELSIGFGRPQKIKAHKTYHMYVGL